ncbi:WW domain-binding protein 11 [Galendromus occidentalis]|uniref:WW domain-binding protein 11 n=1 Tax=Galendromus occidentalis TaxID=34638 RepID=A0AAJ6VVC7_9ACAR|nr:WW domain-binding protein 11 [Galendromus occidentalis]
MGRRSLTSTKGGKFMNPTDQARKEARKKELKKNKKQRMAVRQAVLKGKDPQQIIEDLIKIDEMEYNIAAPPPLSEKVLTDKRRKLMETFERVETLYKKEDQEKYTQLKSMYREYENRRNELVKYFESVKQAEMVTPDQIPLPAPLDFVQDIPMPPIAPPSAPPRSILKKHPSSFFTNMQTVQGNTTFEVKSKAPGVPIGPPPDLSDCSDGEEEAPPVTLTAPKKVHATQLQANPAPHVSAPVKSKSDKQLRFAPQPTTAKDEVLEFLQQLEKVHQKEQAPPMLPPPPAHPMAMPPPPMWNAYPPAGPPPPEFMMPPGMPPQAPQRMSMGPPPKLPPMSQPPPPKLAKLSTAGKTTIQAKPQMRSLQQEVVKFVPTQLRVKKGSEVARPPQKRDPQPPPQQQQDKPTKDDAYAQFMKEMQGLI